MRHLFTAFMLLLGFAVGDLVSAGERTTLGFGRNFNNDAIGDGADRWRSGSYTVSYVRGSGWDGALPEAFGDILEMRLRSEVITADNTVTPAAGDRRYAGVFSMGLHTHFGDVNREFSLGADLVATGPMTGVGRLQTALHDVFGQPTPDTSNQLGNALYPTLSFEMGSVHDRGGLRFRPFVAAQAGVESYIRIGGDLIIGEAVSGDLLLRDDVTGQFYRGVRGEVRPGASLVVGADIARVFDSYYLPSSDGYSLTDFRGRYRAGVHWQGEKSSLFYGVTWLTPEFAAQGQGQAVGSLQLDLEF